MFGDEELRLPREADLLRQHSASAEDIAALEVEEDVPELQRLHLLLERGQPLQRRSVLESLPRAVSEHGGPACDSLLELIGSQLVAEPPVLDESCQEAAAHSLGELCTRLDPPMLELRVLPLMLTALEQDSAEPSDVTCAWVGALLALLESGQLPADALRWTVVPFALAQGDAARPVVGRMVCCYMLGAAAHGHGEAALAEPRALSHALALCQDTEATVRACMGLQLVRLAAAIGPQRASGTLLAELMELTRDEQPEVRASAFASGVALLPTIEHALRRQQLEPALKALLCSCLHVLETAADDIKGKEASFGGMLATIVMRDASPSFRGTSGMGASPELLSTVAEHLPSYLLNLRACGALPPPPTPLVASFATSLTSADTATPAVAPGPTHRRSAEDEAVSVLAERLVGLLAHCPSVELRSAAARALPPLAQCCGAEALLRTHPALPRLLGDPAPQVQALAAGALLPLGRALGPTAAQALLLPQLLRLLRGGGMSCDAGRGANQDGIPSLPCHAAPRRCLEDLPELVSAMAGREEAKGAGESVEAEVCLRLLPVLVELDSRLLAHHWRTTHALLAALSTLLRCLNPSLLEKQLLPLLFRHTAVHTAAPNRQAAVRRLCELHRRLRSTAQRAEVCARLVRELGRSGSYQQRLLYLDACALLLGDDPELACSRAFFKAQGLLSTALELATDPVANVRLKLCGLLLPLKCTLRLPADAQALEHLHLGSVALQGDASRDVRTAASAAQPALSGVEVLIEGSSARRASVGEGARREALDAALQAEEEAMRAEEEKAAQDKEKRAGTDAAGPTRVRRGSREYLPPLKTGSGGSDGGGPNSAGRPRGPTSAGTAAPGAASGRAAVGAAGAKPRASAAPTAVSASRSRRNSREV